MGFNQCIICGSIIFTDTIVLYVYYVYATIVFSHD